MEESIAALRTMSVAELRRKHIDVFGAESVSRHRVWLMRRIAWEVQAQREGGLSQRAQQRAEELARDVDLRLAPKRVKSVAEAAPTASAQLESRDPRLPPPGALLTRQYKGCTVAVRVLDDAFEYDGQAYPSLSAVAKKITGSHLNGYQFFQLGGRR